MKNKQGAYKESFTTAMNSVGNSVNHLTFLRAFKRPSKKVSYAQSYLVFLCH